jgi:hypothetical protein
MNKNSKGLLKILNLQSFKGLNQRRKKPYPKKKIQTQEKKEQTKTKRMMIKPLLTRGSNQQLKEND